MVLPAKSYFRGRWTGSSHFSDFDLKPLPARPCYNPATKFLAGSRCMSQQTSKIERSKPECEVAVEADASVPMRDGVRLVVDNAVFHDSARPSRIVLPVMPAGEHDRNMKSTNES